MVRIDIRHLSSVGLWLYELKMQDYSISSIGARVSLNRCTEMTDLLIRHPMHYSAERAYILDVVPGEFSASLSMRFQKRDDVVITVSAGLDEPELRDLRGGRLLLQHKLSTSRGAVAQPGERRVHDAKVGSSILLGSTN